GGADLLLFERLLELAFVLEQTQVRSDLVRGLGQAGKRVDDTVVLFARVGLSRDQLAPGKPCSLGESAVEILDFSRVAVEKKQERRLRAGGSLGAEKAQIRPRGLHLLQVQKEIARPERRPFSDRRRLGRLEVRVGERG